MGDIGVKVSKRTPVTLWYWLTVQWAILGVTNTCTCMLFPVCLWMRLIQGSRTTDICIGKTAELHCPASQVVRMISARYGRMRLGSCIKTDIEIGCQADILQTADSWCSGKGSCSVANHRYEMDRELGLPCPEDLTPYIELRHQCISGK